MITNLRQMARYLVICAGISLLGLNMAAADEKGDMAGWEKGSKYNQLYNPSEMDRIRAEVLGFKEIIPLPGMSPATVMMVRDGDGDTVMVHLCPVWYSKADDTGLKKGDSVKIRGVWAEIDGVDIFLASKVKKGDYFEFKVRLTKDGTPFWTMTSDELAKELATQ